MGVSVGNGLALCVCVGGVFGYRFSIGIRLIQECSLKHIISFQLDASPGINVMTSCFVLFQG